MDVTHWISHLYIMICAFYSFIYLIIIIVWNMANLEAFGKNLK